MPVWGLFVIGGLLGCLYSLILLLWFVWFGVISLVCIFLLVLWLVFVLKICLCFVLGLFCYFVFVILLIETLLVCFSLFGYEVFVWLPFCCLFDLLFVCLFLGVACLVCFEFVVFS